jgi:hypothetical protein
MADDQTTASLIPTEGHPLHDAEICRRNGWGVGTRLCGDEGQGMTVIEITALGERLLLAKAVSEDGRPCRHDETTWTLKCRDWKEVAP